MKLSQVSTLIKTLQTGQFWYLFPHHYYRWRRSIDIEKTAPMTTVAYGTTQAIEIHMLTGAKHHVDLLYAAKSFINHYPAPVSLVIHADASITDEIVQKIQRHLPQAKLLTRSERDKLVEPELQKRGLKHCQAFREANVFGAKLIDAFLLSHSDKIILLDTDCLAFQPLQRLYEFASSASPNVFAKDPQSYPYSISPDAIKRDFGVEMLPYLCAGFCLLHRQLIDFEIVEQWLSTPNYPMTHHYAEQTITAAFVSRNHHVVMLPEDEYNTGRSQDERTCHLIHYCGHYLSPTRIAMRQIGQPLVLQQLLKSC